MRKFNYLMFFIAGLATAFYIVSNPESNSLEAKTKIQKAKSEMITKIKHDILEEVYIIKPRDVNRLQDCSDEDIVYHGGKLQTHPWMNFYGGQTDPLNGFLTSNGWPLYVYIEGLNTFHDDTTMLVGLRGDTAGPHRSRVTTTLHDLRRRYKDTLIYMPSSYYLKKR